MVGAPTFETIYTEHAAEVHRAAFSILRDAALAEDVVQEVFERVWRGSGHDERRGPLGPYLVCSPAAAPSTSGAGARPASGSSIASRSRPACSGRPHSRRRPRSRAPSERRLARAAVRRLPDEQRQAIGLAYWGGLSARELATVEGIPLGTAKSRVRLGLAKLSRDPELVAA